jgi:2-polyprenyl-6-methoxyphenol hydroxylase-like FAD-dependent oxidoreductase
MNLGLRDAVTLGDALSVALQEGRELAVRQGHKGPQEEIDEILADLS